MTSETQGATRNYRDLHAHLDALRAEGLLVEIDRPVDKDSQLHPLVRWQFVPEDGEHRLSPDEMKTAPADFLEPALIERTKKGPVRWTMAGTIGEPGDVEDNPTVAWPEGRRKLTFGTLTLRSASPQAGAECEKINFDPLIMADGIAPTNEPVLLFRSPAYAVSFAKRISGQ